MDGRRQIKGCRFDSRFPTRTIEAWDSGTLRRVLGLVLQRLEVRATASPNFKRTPSLGAFSHGWQPTSCHSIDDLPRLHLPPTSPRSTVTMSAPSLHKAVAGRPWLAKILRPLAQMYANAAGYRQMGLRYGSPSKEPIQRPRTGIMCSRRSDDLN